MTIPYSFIFSTLLAIGSAAPDVAPDFEIRGAAEMEIRFKEAYEGTDNVLLRSLRYLTDRQQMEKCLEILESNYGPWGTRSSTGGVLVDPTPSMPMYLLPVRCIHVDCGTKTVEAILCPMASRQYIIFDNPIASFYITDSIQDNDCYYKIRESISVDSSSNIQGNQVYNIMAEICIRTQAQEEAYVQDVLRRQDDWDLEMTHTYGHNKGKKLKRKQI